MRYFGIMAANTYRVLRVHGWDEITVEAENLTLAQARAKEKELKTAEAALHPGKTAWSKDGFHLDLEGAQIINKQLTEARTRRCQLLER